MALLPHVMVSSTFYDLRQVRADIECFIRDDIGCTPLLSESYSFPVDPDKDTIANCMARVERDADILVLIVGGRYGYVDANSSRSITNLEYLAARQKGIPIFAFVERAVLAHLPTWQNNRDGDFSSVVDSTKLFEFVMDVRNTERRWTFPFESASDITTVLRQQIAYLFSDALQLRLRLKGGGIPSYLLDLGPASLRLALEKPPCWEHKLFLQSLADQVARRADLIREFRANLRIYKSEYVAFADAGQWNLTRLHELSSFIQSATTLFAANLSDALGPPGQPGDAEHLVWVSRMLGRVLEEALHWGNRLRCAHVEEPYDLITKELALAVTDIITQFEKFPKSAMAQVELAIERALSEGPDRTSSESSITMVITLSNFDRISAATDECRAKIERMRPDRDSQ